MSIPKCTNPPGLKKVRDSIRELGILPNEAVGASGAITNEQLAKAGIQVHERDELVEEATRRSLKWGTLEEGPGIQDTSS